MGEKEGIKTAIYAAIVGWVIYGTVHFLLGYGVLSVVIGGIIWLASLRWLYNMRWFKTVSVAIVIWISTSLLGILLPFSLGPF